MIIVKAKDEVRFINEEMVKEMELSKLKKSHRELFVAMAGAPSFSIRNVEEIIYMDGKNQLRFDGEGKETTEDYIADMMDRFRKNFIGLGNDPIGPTLR